MPIFDGWVFRFPFAGQLGDWVGKKFNIQKRIVTLST